MSGRGPSRPLEGASVLALHVEEYLDEAGSQNGDASFSVGKLTMRTTYDEADDILVVHLSEKPIIKEGSQDWNTHVSYAEDGTIVEIVILEASKQGAWPLLRSHAA